MHLPRAHYSVQRYSVTCLVPEGVCRASDRYTKEPTGPVPSTHMEHEQIIFGERPTRGIALPPHAPHVHDEVSHCRRVGISPAHRTRTEVVNPQEGLAPQVRRSSNQGKKVGSRNTGSCGNRQLDPHNRCERSPLLPTYPQLSYALGRCVHA